MAKKKPRIPARPKVSIPRQQSRSYEECETKWQRLQEKRKVKRPVTAKVPWEKAPWEKTGFTASAAPAETGIGGGNWMAEWPDIPKDATPFLEVLRALGNHLQGQSRDLCNALRRELVSGDLVDLKTGRWLLFNITPEMQNLFAQIDELSAVLRSDRRAIAMAIVDFDITGTSFTAVYEDLKRKLKAYRSCLGQKTSKTVSSEP